jgi:hypothetical protein
MRTIICLGAKACDVGEAFENNPQYQVKLIDKDIEGDNCFSIVKQKTPEEYEKNTPNMSVFLSDISEEILFILSGESEVANCSLKILQQIKDKKINIVYLFPQLEFLTNKQVLQERMIRNVLQEYTRSGLFQNIILLDCSLIENIMGETSIKDFDSQFSVTTMTLLNTFMDAKSIEPEIDKSHTPKEISKILTFAYYDHVNNNEKSVYNMGLIDDKIYHFYFTEETLNGNSKMLREIKEKLKNKAVDNTKVSYTIRGTSGESDFCFVTYYSKAIQP